MRGSNKCFPLTLRTSMKSVDSFVKTSVALEEVKPQSLKETTKILGKTTSVPIFRAGLPKRQIWHLQGPVSALY